MDKKQDYLDRPSAPSRLPSTSMKGPTRHTHLPILKSALKSHLPSIGIDGSPSTHQSCLPRRPALSDIKNTGSYGSRSENDPSHVPVKKQSTSKVLTRTTAPLEISKKTLRPGISRKSYSKPCTPATAVSTSPDPHAIPQRPLSRNANSTHRPSQIVPPVPTTRRPAADDKVLVDDSEHNNLLSGIPSTAASLWTIAAASNSDDSICLAYLEGDKHEDDALSAISRTVTLGSLNNEDQLIVSDSYRPVGFSNCRDSLCLTSVSPSKLRKPSNSQDRSSGLPVDMLTILDELENIAASIPATTKPVPAPDSMGPGDAQGTSPNALQSDILRTMKILDRLGYEMKEVHDPPKVSSQEASEADDPPRWNASDKGKWRAPEVDIPAIKPPTPLVIFESKRTDPPRHAQPCYIYDRGHAPEFLVGGSKSLIAMPAYGYHSKAYRARSIPTVLKSKMPVLSGRVPSLQAPTHARKSCDGWIDRRPVPMAPARPIPHPRKSHGGGGFFGLISKPEIVAPLPTTGTGRARGKSESAASRSKIPTTAPRTSIPASHRPVEGPRTRTSKPRFSLAKDFMKKLTV
ncbi:hypothetical protein PLICRDRAFT_44286 [Plicaturopsis crispa FD-325 SS-3]|nr:hypothetical protein PLICRDRAFT_44286 [Plicaturopsis crispa FD-325 SS-3]